jgi:hypothetical protein
MRDPGTKVPSQRAEPTADAVALLELLALGEREFAAGKVTPLAELVARLRSKHIGR